VSENSDGSTDKVSMMELAKMMLTGLKGPEAEADPSWPLAHRLGAR
jgi:hypothetical protein